MAWDGTAWVKLKRPLTEEENARQLKVDVAASEQPKDDFSVFSMNEVFLESTNSAFQQRGLLTYGCLGIVVVAAFFAWTMLWCLNNPPGNGSIHGATLAIMYGGAVFFLLFALAVLFVGFWGLSQENFTWTRVPVRFNRQTRMVYAFRGAGSRGVISVPWEKAFFFIERRPRDPISRAYVFNIRCHVLNDTGLVIQSFSVGSRVATIDDEKTENGRSIVNGLNCQFEYLRQYMEQGPRALTYPDLVPTKVSLANSLRIWRHDDHAILAERNLFTTLLVVVLSPFIYFTAVLHYIGQRTSRQPAWPPEVERECERAPLDESVRA
ncbi:hypothetical protein P0D72_07670 [Paraburkholderia sediminicola]|uniref:DUF6708 domain-containing protein n=1 Tax=Paraburkholderia sediminicola TaxID=458836 RepID=UPI0038BAAC45